VLAPKPIIQAARAQLLDIYEARTNLTRAQLEAAMQTDNYLTAEEAVAQGFAAAVETFEAKVPVEAVARLERGSPAAQRVAAELTRSGQPDAKARAQRYLEQVRGPSFRRSYWPRSGRAA
jgi:hypothetical protein